MPVYDYKCAEHGLFHSLVTLENSAKPAPCPECGSLAGRVIMIAPELLDMDSEKRKSMERNEKASHAPEFSTAERRVEDEQHAKGCGCSSSSVNKSKMLLTAKGEKIFPSMRPWMIHH